MTLRKEKHQQAEIIEGVVRWPAEDVAALWPRFHHLSASDIRSVFDGSIDADALHEYAARCEERRISVGRGVVRVLDPRSEFSYVNSGPVVPGAKHNPRLLRQFARFAERVTVALRASRPPDRRDDLP